jgi:hypothetical protein
MPDEPVTPLPQSHTEHRWASLKRADWVVEQPKQWVSVAGWSNSQDLWIKIF